MYQYRLIENVFTEHDTRSDYHQESEKQANHKPNQPDTTDERKRKNTNSSSACSMTVQAGFRRLASDITSVEWAQRHIKNGHNKTERKGHRQIH